MAQLNKANEIYTDLKRRILRGEFDTYQILPTEKTLEADYQASRNTIRKAIRQLNSDGLVYSKLGSANIVLQRVAVHDLLIDSGNTNRASIIQSEEVVTQVLAFETKQIDVKLAQKTMFPEDSICYHVIRLRIVNGRPGMIDDSFFLAEVVPNLSQTIAENSIYRYIQSISNQKIIGSRLVDRIILANDFDKQYLQLKKENCVGLTQTWSYLDTGKIFEYTEIHFAPEEYVRTRFVNQQQ